MSAQTCRLCGRACAMAGTPEAHDLPIYGVSRSHGRIVCDYCGAEQDRERLATGVPTVAYLSSDGQFLTTWGGCKLARIFHHSSSRSGWNGSEVFSWSARFTYNGRRVDLYGKGSGPGMCTTARTTKATRQEVTA